MIKSEAESELRRIFNIDTFYDDQWATISRLFKGEHLLLVERTGFGKSLCYQFPATQFKGLTVIFSPLLALMRDQVNYLNSIGIAAACVNSEQEPSENHNILKQAKNNQLKILYIAPERQENQEWLDAVRYMNLAMVVIDEAHCISVWGHDFRPAFRRIINLVKLLPRNFPVLAATATATDCVVNDIRQQMDSDVTLIRGNLLRENFSLNAVVVNDEDKKLIWLAEFLSNIEGNGLIYTGTCVATETYSAWLQSNGIKAIHYNADLDAAVRREIEEGLQQNRWKCVVSTNALGMGINKPDIRFIIHTQIPQSPIHYYQEIGRAGRDGKLTKLFLLFCDTDRDLPTHFIQNSRPSLEKYDTVTDALQEEPLGEREIMRKTNLTQTQVRVIKADLIDQGIIKEVLYGQNKKYEYQFNAPQLDSAPFEQLRKFKFCELNQMVEYVQLTFCRTEYLCKYLGNDFPYWMALSHLPNWGNEKINRLIIEIINNKKVKFSEFFSLNETDLKSEFGLSDQQTGDILNAKKELPNYAFLTENLIEQGFQLIPIDSDYYSETMKQNLKIKNSPPLLYVKGNIKLLNEDSVAVVGSREAPAVALEFTKNIAKKCANNYEVVVSGFAKGVDKMALDATLEYNGHSIIVLPQGILTFGSGIKKYYKKIIEGDVLILSTFHPKAPWLVGLAMNRNTYIYGLAKTIYVAESNAKGGTWNGVMDGLKKGRKIFIRKPEPSEKNANDLLIMKGAIPVDLFGEPIEAKENQVEERIKSILSKGHLTAKVITDELQMDIDQKDLQKLLSNLPFVEAKKIKNKKYYFLKNSIPAQLSFSFS